MSWNNATDYCTRMGKRLATEAEWEYAARGGLAGKRYAKGDTINCDDANYGRANSSSECWDYNGLQNDTHPVGTYAPNGYGLYDMDGNLAEYVNDWFDLEYYQFCVDHDVVNDPPGPSSGSFRTARTAMYEAGSGDYVRVSARYLYSPGETGWNVGFRCAQDCPNNKETGLCDNGVDDDCDGFVDDADSDCNGGSCAASVAASTMGEDPIHGASHLTKYLVYFLLPMGVILAWSIRATRR